MPQNLKRFAVTVHHSGYDRGERVCVVAPNSAAARTQGIFTVRNRHSFPTSVTLFAEVVEV